MPIPKSQVLFSRNLALELRECQVNLFPVTRPGTYKVSRIEQSFLTIWSGKLRNQVCSDVLQEEFKEITVAVCLVSSRTAISPLCASLLNAKNHL